MTDSHHLENSYINLVEIIDYWWNFVRWSRLWV